MATGAALITGLGAFCAGFAAMMAMGATVAGAVLGPLAGAIFDDAIALPTPRRCVPLLELNHRLKLIVMIATTPMAARNRQKRASGVKR